MWNWLQLYFLCDFNELQARLELITWVSTRTRMFFHSGLKTMRLEQVDFIRVLMGRKPNQFCYCRCFP